MTKGRVICAWCKKIIRELSEEEVGEISGSLKDTHSMCHECLEEHFFGYKEKTPKKNETED